MKVYADLYLVTVWSTGPCVEVVNREPILPYVFLCQLCTSRIFRVSSRPVLLIIEWHRTHWMTACVNAVCTVLFSSKCCGKTHFACTDKLNKTWNWSRIWWILVFFGFGITYVYTDNELHKYGVNSNPSLFIYLFFLQNHVLKMVCFDLNSHRVETGSSHRLNVKTYKCIPDMWHH